MNQDSFIYENDPNYVEIPQSNGFILFINKFDGKAYLRGKNGAIIPFPDSSTNDKNFVMQQSVAAVLWSVPHNLNKRCAVQIVDNSFNEIEAKIHWVNNNEVEITFNSPTTGYVYCN